MTAEQDELVRAYMQNGQTLEKTMTVMETLAKVKQTDEEALAILLMLMATTKNIIESRKKKDNNLKITKQHFFSV